MADHTSPMTSIFKVKRSHWIRQNKVPFHQQMKPLLDAYAAQLTRAVDTAHSTRRLTRSLAN
ncbi:hypothetical protein BJP39_23310 [Streptomyces sp. CC77]|nr:hypothetical protein BJP39_23310 [Streptomyces sp. CC77]